MYNRYIPQPDGTYRRDRVDDHPTKPPAPPPVPQKQDCPPPSKPDYQPPKPECPPHEPPKQECKSKHQPFHPAPPAGDFLRRLLPQNLDTGDLMVIILLLLMAGDCQEDRTTALLTLAIYLLMQ